MFQSVIIQFICGDSTSIPIEDQLQQDYNYPNVIIDAGNGRSLYYAGDTGGKSGVDSVDYYREYLTGNICWVIALGTNDAAATTFDKQQVRFTDMMNAIGDDPVLWINVWMDSPNRPEYNVDVASAWNSMLLEKTQIYKNMRVYDWAELAKNNPDWFIYDHLHYNNEGSEKRARMIVAVTNIIFLGSFYDF